MHASTTERSHAHRTAAPHRHVVLALVALLALAIACLAAHAPPARGAAPDARVHLRPNANFAPHVGRNILVTRGSFLGRQVATWYGPGFFGRRTACGQTLRRATWGIAHRTLPCGTLVTLTRGGRSVSVRVIDRGPYSGASIDLTARTRDYLHFIDGSVKLAVVTKYRLARR